MSTLIQFPTNPTERIQDNEGPLEAAAVSQPTCSNLKLVVSNPSPLPPEPSLIIRNTDTPPSFTVKVRLRGPYLYEMMIQDPSHYLKCELTLEVEEVQNEGRLGAVTCHFPTITDKKLKAFVEDDETLYGMIMIQFQMKILEQLLLFCANYSASRLIIYTDDEQAEELGIYEDFLIYQDQTLTSKGEKTEMVISTDQKTYDHWIGFMEEVNLKFGQELWREQRSNPIIWDYLRSHCVS